jgi:hypothetical protein
MSKLWIIALAVLIGVFNILAGSLDMSIWTAKLNILVGFACLGIAGAATLRWNLFS